MSWEVTQQPQKYPAQQSSTGPQDPVGILSLLRTAFLASVMMTTVIHWIAIVKIQYPPMVPRRLKSVLKCPSTQIMKRKTENPLRTQNWVRTFSLEALLPVVRSKLVLDITCPIATWLKALKENRFYSGCRAIVKNHDGKWNIVMSKEIILHFPH